MTKRKKTRRILLSFFLILCACALVVLFSLNAHVKNVGGQKILSPEEAAELSDVDCILVLGCHVREDGSPSGMLEDRLRRGVSLYDMGVSEKLLMSGDHGQEDYDEVNTMKDYAVEHGVPSEDVFMDHAGFSTYESIVRAKEVFCAEKIVIVTQEYHLYRALYLAKQLGLDAVGVASDYHTYSGQAMREVREVLARAKDVYFSLVRPEPTYGGDAIPVSGNGDVTNDP